MRCMTKTQISRHSQNPKLILLHVSITSVFRSSVLGFSVTMYCANLRRALKPGSKIFRFGGCPVAKRRSIWPISDATTTPNFETRRVSVSGVGVAMGGAGVTGLLGTQTRGSKKSR